MKFVHRLFLLFVFLFQDVGAAVNEWPHHMIRTYSPEGDEGRQAALEALSHVTVNSRGWVSQQAGQIIPAAERHLLIPGEMSNAHMLLGLVSLAYTAESQHAYVEMTRLLNIPLVAKRESLFFLASISPNERPWALLMIRLCIEKCEGNQMNLLNILAQTAQECREHNPPVEVSRIYNEVFGRLERVHGQIPVADFYALIRHISEELRGRE
jgi:hypothetical protein